MWTKKLQYSSRICADHYRNGQEDDVLPKSLAARSCSIELQTHPPSQPLLHSAHPRLLVSSTTRLPIHVQGREVFLSFSQQRHIQVSQARAYISQRSQRTEQLHNHVCAHHFPAERAEGSVQGEITPEEGLELRGIYFFQGLPGNCGCKISSVCDAAGAMPSKLHQRRLQTATAELHEGRQRKTSAAKPILQSSCSEND